MSLFRDLPGISLLTYLYVTLSALLLSSPSLAVQGAAALVLVAAEWEGGFALRLGHFAGQMDKGLDERSSVGHRDLPQPDLLLPCPLLSRLAVHSPLILQVQLITHNNNSHLFFVTAAVDVFLQSLYAFEGLFAVDAVDEQEAVGESEVVPRKLVTLAQPARVVKPHLLSGAAVRFH